MPAGNSTLGEISIANPQTECRLLALPPELRNRIYEYTFYVGTVYLVKITNPARPPSVLSVLQTCHQIRDEAEAIFYQVNTITIGMFKNVGRIWPHILRGVDIDAAQRRMGYITRLTLFCTFSPQSIVEYLGQLAKLGKLQSIEFQFGPDPYWNNRDTFRETLRENRESLSKAFTRTPDLKYIKHKVLVNVHWNARNLRDFDWVVSELQSVLDGRVANLIELEG